MSMGDMSGKNEILSLQKHNWHLNHGGAYLKPKLIKQDLSASSFEKVEINHVDCIWQLNSTYEMIIYIKNKFNWETLSNFELEKALKMIINVKENGKASLLYGLQVIQAIKKEAN